ncbi:MAG: MFS transporter [Desulfarculaceae bacterium]
MHRSWGGKAAVAASCVAIFWPGAFVFAYIGVMAPYWQAALQVNRAAVGQTMFFVLAAVGAFMFLCGRWQQKIGHPRMAAAGAILCGASTLMVSQASCIETVYLWSFLAGLSCTFVYLPVLTVVQHWFPAQRGLMSGLINLVFGLSGAAASPLFNLLLNRVGYETTTIASAVAAIAMGLAAAPLIRLPRQPLTKPGQNQGQPQDLGASITVSQAVRLRSFWALWLVGGLAGAGGIALVTLAVPFGLSRGLSPERAVLILTAFNLTNGFSRLISGYFSDFFSRNATMSLSFLAAGAAYILWLHFDGLAAWAVLAAVVGFSFGTLFAVAVPLASDCFGLEHFGAIFGLAFTAYGFGAGALGPWLSGYILDATQGDYSPVFAYLGALLIASALIVLMVRPKR